LAIDYFGKGSKERIVPIGASSQKVLRRHVFHFCPMTPCDAYLFLTFYGKQLGVNAVKLLLDRLGKKAGVPRLHAHLCRHTFATRFLINGGDVFTLQQILGHSTLERVRHYVNLASNHVAIQHQRYSPLDRLNLRGY
jgi:site-specific recombinase XerD